MATCRSLKLVLAVLVAGLGAGATFAWAGVLMGGHRADRIGTFEPAISNVVAPVHPTDPASVSTTSSAPSPTVAGTITSHPPRTSIGTITRPDPYDDHKPTVDDD